MQNSKLRLYTSAFALLALCFCSNALAQQQAKGFAVERMYLSAPGGGWFVMDELAIGGHFSGTANITLSHAHNSLLVHSADGTRSLAVVSEEQLADVGLSATFERYRIYLNLTGPTYLRGNSGVIDGQSFAGPKIDVGSQPDTFSDMRFGFDARIYGEPESRFRLGVGAQLFVPSGNQADYISDGTYRAMLRLLFAGESGNFVYAGETGVHLRKIQDSAPGSPQGSEFLLGFALGEKFNLAPSTTLTIGPELYGASAAHSFLKPAATDLEWLLTTRMTQKDSGNRQSSLRLGFGSGFVSQFGAPEWRAVIGVELMGSSN